MQQLSLETDMPKDLARPRSREPQVLSVSDLNKAIRGTLEGGFPLVWLKGEISNFKPHTSGHWYFSLKDSKAQISAVMFRGFNQTVKFRPHDGMEVIVRGKVTVYEPRGNYQIFCELMEPLGAGAMQLAFEQLKLKLEREGLFAPERKRPLPLFPQHVAVITSPTGAAIRDILKVLHRRFKGLRVTLIPAVVQGQQAAESICAALEAANRLTDVDVLIVGRGGGSLEDLWCFNEETVVRAIAASRRPTISAVGHEIDFTIADFVADVRAPTPSAAAEMVVKSADELTERLELTLNQLTQASNFRLETWNHRVLNLRRHLVDPKRRLQDLAQRCDELHSRLNSGMRRSLQDKQKHLISSHHRLKTPTENLVRLKNQVNGVAFQLESHLRLHFERCRAQFLKAAAVLDNMSPLKVLERGYAVALVDGEVLRDVSEVEVGDTVRVKVARGGLVAEIKEIRQEQGDLNGF